MKKTYKKQHAENSIVYRQLLKISICLKYTCSIVQLVELLVFINRCCKEARKLVQRCSEKSGQWSPEVRKHECF